MLEGVAVYLDPPVVERVLAEFRAATAVGGLLAVSVSIALQFSTSQTRARFRERARAAPRRA